MYLRLKKLKKPMKKKKLFWNKKSQLVFAESMMITCGCMLLGVPLIGSGFGSGDSYYEVTLAGKTVGLQDGSSAVSALEKNEIASQVTQQKYADNVTALTDLSIGRVDAVLLDEVVARYYETQNPGVYTVLDDSFAEEEYGIGFKKGNDELREAVQKVFDEMIEDGTAAEISEKWFGKDIVVKP